ncbi:mannose-6-phosphate isomerase, class I [Brevibacillus migulae]|uniref:mannose-6-phosphate isomerase, class I n=1 Tax=Brevibacillus migulae TaxID=1644114 RepID=UPI00106E8733|nr:mannose-6-phosphate isomerase, class I [Brevibacillus migulae]
MSAYPIFLTPVCKERLWGGEALRRFGYSFAQPNIGEAWAVAALPDGDNLVENGDCRGMTLSQLWRERPELFGNPDEPEFPLLIKIIDAREDLSIQVHPNDEQAQRLEGRPYGKTECWYILDCAPDSRLVFGHNAAVSDEMERLIAAGDWTALLQQRKIQRGDFLFVPSGTVHAIGKGTILLEVQQSSDSTYRLYDYDRRDAQGNLRELHLEKCIDVTNVPHHEVSYQRRTIRHPSSTQEILTSNRLFQLSRWEVRGETQLDTRSPYALMTVVAGYGKLHHGEQAYELTAGKSVLIPHGCEGIVVEGELELFLTHPGKEPEAAESYRIGVDIGGTNLRAAVVDQAGQIVKRVAMKTFAEKGPDFVIRNLQQMIGSLMQEYPVTHIGLACPGPLDAKAGIILSPPNLPGWDRIDLKGKLAATFDIPVTLDNDANAAALGEALFGAGKGKRSVFYVTISTGIGGGFVYNGNIIQGAHFCAGEVGNMIIRPDGPAHPMLNQGSWETLASGTALNRQAQQIDQRKSLFQLEQEGNAQAKEAIEQFVANLATGIANLVHILDPDTIILGGGVMKSRHLFWEQLHRAVDERLYPQLRGKIDLQVAQLEDDAGIIGAAFLEPGA